MPKTALLFLVTILLVMSGCGSDDSDGGSDPGGTDPSTEVSFQVDPTQAVVETGETLQISARVDGTITNRLTFALLHEESTESSQIGTVTRAGLFRAPNHLPDPPAVRVRVESTLFDEVRFVEITLVAASGVHPPVFSEVEGIYEPASLRNGVRLESSSPGAEIYYTIDGSVPTPNDDQYVSPIDVPSTMTIRAIVHVPGRGSSATANSTYVIPVGASLPLSLPDLDGNTHSLSSHRGQVVLVDFWAAWCAPCVRSLPKLQEYRDSYSDQGFQVFAVSVDRTSRGRISTVERFLRDNNIDLEVLLDSEQEVSGAWGIRSIPTAILIDKRGRVVMRKIGYVDGQDISEIIRVCLAD